MPLPNQNNEMQVNVDASKSRYPVIEYYKIDMDMAIFLRSAHSLVPTFCE